MTNKHKCGGRIRRVGWIVGRKLSQQYGYTIYTMSINDGFAHFECSICAQTFKQRLRQKKPR